MRDYRTLLEQAMGGSSTAFEELVRRFQDHALGIAMRRLGDLHLAQDAVQEAFLVAHLKLPTLKNPDSFPSWFSRIVTRCSIKLGKDAAKHRPACGLDHIDTLADGHPGPLEIMTRFQDRAMVSRLLGMLSGMDREVCVLRYQHGLSYNSIAEQLGLPLGTIKRRLHKARNTLVKLREQETGRVTRVGCLPISDHLLAMVAQNQNPPNGQELRTRRFLSWPSLIEALRNDTLDVAFIMAPLAMELRAKGLGIRYVLDGHHDGSSITVNSKDLVNNGGSWRRQGTWALPYRISTHSMLLNHMLGQDPVPYDPSPTAKYISPSYIIRSLRQREVDAFFCSEPWGTRSEAEGTGRVVARSRDIAPGHICCIVVAREAFAKHHGGMLDDYLQRLREAGRFVRRRPETAAAILSHHTGVDQDISRQVLAPDRVSFEDLTPTRDRIRATMGLALESTVIEKSCDLDSFLLSIS
ncbi:MAG: sigma-70 family RNA polymerase sigma factor [Desulfovibrio sp.]|nr:MAG: sigma-70 family RNA polymerase sigma factor [Desulfovibrio sp.]